MELRATNSLERKDKPYNMMKSSLVTGASITTVNCYIKNLFGKNSDTSTTWLFVIYPPLDSMILYFLSTIFLALKLMRKKKTIAVWIESSNGCLIGISFGQIIKWRRGELMNINWYGRSNRLPLLHKATPLFSLKRLRGSFFQVVHGSSTRTT